MRPKQDIAILPPSRDPPFATFARCARAVSLALLLSLHLTGVRAQLLEAAPGAYIGCASFILFILSLSVTGPHEQLLHALAVPLPRRLPCLSPCPCRIPRLLE
jgi:hypothetical protein